MYLTTFSVVFLTGDAPTTSERSTILLPTQVRLILEVLRYVISSYGKQCNIEVPLY